MSRLARLSLTARLGLLFMLALTGVLLGAGLVVNHLTRQHFIELDSQALHERLEASRRLLAGASAQELEARLPQLHDLLAAHQDLHAELWSRDGRLLLRLEHGGAIPPAFHQQQGGIWEWQHDDHELRGLTAGLEAPGQPLLLLALDVTHHTHFFVMLERWLWIALACCALLSAGLGWLVASFGLRPLREVTRVAARVSASSLTERIALPSVPAELHPLVSTLNAMLERLDDAFVRLSGFSADIAHELRTPLTRLITHSQVMLGQARTLEQYQEVLYGNLEDLEAMARMIDDMLFLAKADNGLLVPHRQQLCAHQLVDDLLEFYQPLADEQQVQLLRQGTGELSGDADMLRRALSNLLSNALRYTAAGQRIRVDIEERGARLHLCVENPGAEIPAVVREHLFERFYRLDPARHASGHAGLGLALTRSIVQAHGGSIHCESAAGLNRFILDLPGSPDANPR